MRAGAGKPRFLRVLSKEWLKMAGNRAVSEPRHPVNAKNSTVPGVVRHWLEARTTLLLGSYDIGRKLVRHWSWGRTTLILTWYDTGPRLVRHWFWGRTTWIGGRVSWLRGRTALILTWYDIGPRLVRHQSEAGTTLFLGSYDIDPDAARHWSRVLATFGRGLARHRSRAWRH